MPTESEIIEIRVQDALRELSRIKTPNIRLAARLYNAPFKRVEPKIRSEKMRTRVVLNVALRPLYIHQIGDK